ncbi:MAG: hypothetical protein LBJ18_03205 [Rickettsiales bacterium]|jgi:hypothetical protein|nr:hypothetical protein [Rickettsiales bacterium]
MKIKPYFYKIAILALLGLGATTSNSRKKENTQVGPHRYDLFNVSYNFSENLELSQAVSRALVDGCIYGYKLKIVDKEIKSVAETRRTSGFGWSSDTEIGFYNLYTKSSNKRILDHIAANRQLLPRVFEHEKWHIHNRKADIFSASLSESKRAENAIDNELSAYTLDETVGGGAY